LTVINLVAIPVTNCSANPARSLGVAWFAGGGALSQMWLFIVAPDGRSGDRRCHVRARHRCSHTDIGVAQNPELEESQRTA
jgi:aquaporin Z